MEVSTGSPNASYESIFEVRTMKKLLKGNIVETKKLGEMNLISYGAILLDEDGTILDIYKTIPNDLEDIEIIDYQDYLIMQSFCDMHLHAPQYPMLGMGMDLPLVDWLNTYTFKTESRFNDVDYAREIYCKLAKNLIDEGTTRVVMFSSLHLESTIVLMEELEKAGVSGYVGKVNMDRNSIKELAESTTESENNTLLFLEEAKRFKNIKPIITPRFTPSCSNELMKWLGQVAKDNNLYVQSHLSENKGEIEWVKELHNDVEEYWETYFKYGLWKSHTLMAHGVHSSPRERKAMKDHDVILVHCPDSNVNLVSGVCPLRTYLNERVWVALGSDIAGGSLLPMYQNIQQAIKISKIQSINTEGRDNFISVNEGYYLATTSGHRYFDNSLGFEKGKKLHAIVVDDSHFTKATRPLNLQERFERAIYLMNKNDIIAVYSEGRQVK